MGIDVFKSNLNRITSENVTRMVADVMFPDLAKVTDFDTTRMYYSGDLVYRLDPTTGLNKIYKCKSNKVSAGTFNASDWYEYWSADDIYYKLAAISSTYSGFNADTVDGKHASDLVLATDVVTTATANKILKLDANSKLPASITGNADGNAATSSKWATSRTFAITGDGTLSTTIDGSANVSASLALATTGVTAGTYTKVTVDTKGRVTAGTSLVLSDLPSIDWTKLINTPTTLAGYGITDAMSTTGPLNITGSTTFTQGNMVKKELYYIGVQSADYMQTVILLHPIYNGTAITENYCIGNIYATRGGTSSTNRVAIARVNTRSSYTSNMGSLESENEKYTLVTCTYNSVVYMAIKLPYSSAFFGNGIYFEGMIKSSGAESLKLIDYYNQNTSTALNTEVNTSIATFTPSISTWIDTVSTTFAGNITSNGGTLTLGGGTSNIIKFAQAGISSPTSTGGSGMKLDLWNDGRYAIGMDTGAIWYTSGGSHRWYSQNGTSTSTPTNIMTLDGTGILTTTSFLSTNPNSTGDSIGLNWDTASNVARLRIGGTGSYANADFQIQGPSNAVRMSVGSGANVTLPATNASITLGVTTGGTYNGNIFTKSADQYPFLSFRSGTTYKSQIMSDVNTGTMYIDTAGSLIVRNAPNSGSNILSLTNAGVLTSLNNTLDNGSGAATFNGIIKANNGLSMLAKGTATSTTTYASGDISFVRSYWNGTAATSGVSYLTMYADGGLTFTNESGIGKLKVTQNGALVVGSTTVNDDVVGNIALNGSTYNRISSGSAMTTTGQGGILQFTGTADGVGGYGAWLTYNAYYNGTNWKQPRGNLGSYAYTTNYHLGFAWLAAAATNTDGGDVTLTKVAGIDANGNFTARTLVSTVATGAPLYVTSTTTVTNLSADTVRGFTTDQNLRTTDNVTFNRVTATALSLGGYGFEKYVGTFTTAAIANQKIDLYFTGSFDGQFEVTVSGTYSTGNGSGRVSKAFALSLASSTTINSQSTRYTEALGGIAGVIAISDVTWDATNNRWKIQIAQITSTNADSFSVIIKGSTGNQPYTNNLLNAALGSVYTTDTTVFSNPVASYPKLVIRSASDAYGITIDPSNSIPVNTNNYIRGSGGTSGMAIQSGSDGILLNYDTAYAVKTRYSTLDDGTGAATFAGAISSIKGPSAGGYAHFAMKTNAGVIRFGTGLITSETGTGNAGSDYAIWAYDDSGASLGTALKIIRSSLALSSFKNTLDDGSGSMSIVGNVNLKTTNGDFKHWVPTDSVGGWARGYNFYTYDGATRIAAMGLYGTAATYNYLYFGFGTSPWSSGQAGIYISPNGTVSTKNNMLDDGIGNSSFAGINITPVATATSTNTAYASGAHKFSRSTWNGTAAVNVTSYLQVNSSGVLSFVNESGSTKFSIGQGGSVSTSTATLDDGNGNASFVKVTASQMSLGGYSFEKYVGPFTSTQTANQKVDLYFTGYVSGNFEVEVVGSWTYGNTSGKLTKLFGVYLQSNGTISAQTTRYTEAIGGIASKIAISDVTWDSTNSRYRIQIAHLDATTANTYKVFIRGADYSASNVGTLLSSVGLSSIYTTDTTTFSAPVINFPNVTGTTPFAVASTTMVANLNSQYVNGYGATIGNNANTAAVRDGNKAVYAAQFISDVATGTAPLAVSSSTTVANLSADMVDGYHLVDIQASISKLKSTDNRIVKPTDTVKSAAGAYFTSNGGLNAATNDADYQDLLVLNTYSDSSGGKVNALAFDKSEFKIRHYQAAQADTVWGTAKTLAYSEDVLDLAGSNTMTGQLKSTLATGTAPFTVASTTRVDNLNANYLNGFNTATAATASTVAVRDASGDLYAATGRLSTGTTISTGDFRKYAGEIIIPAATSNAKVDLYFPANSIIMGTFDITVIGSWNNINATGRVTKRFSFNGSATGNISAQTTRYEEAIGPASNYWAISDVSWDSTNSRWRVQIAFLGSTTASYAEKCTVVISGNNATTVASYLTTLYGATLGSVYTTDTTVFANPVVGFTSNVTMNDVATKYGSASSTHSFSFKYNSQTNSLDLIYA